ncbi:hypothetical protein B0O99DRAFT_622681 [Bisporella sp. PMI_857]|nr:hypothetical protein B0O99DRAFT_622681 [Bisporella sp. PMI_857]
MPIISCPSLATIVAPALSMISDTLNKSCDNPCHFRYTINLFRRLEAGFQLGQARKFLGKSPRNAQAWLNSLCNHLKPG